MKTHPLIALAALISLAAGPARAQTPGDYRTVGNGSWSDPAVWERFDGSAWNPAVAPPTSTDNAITVQATDTVAVAAGVTIDQTVVASGAELVVNTGVTLTVNNGTGTDLSVSGTLTSAGTVSGTGSILFGAGGTYRHNYTTTAGTIPTATWDAASTCAVVGYTTNTTGPGGLLQSFGHFTWDAPNQTGAVSAGGNLRTINGNFTVSSTGSTGIFRLTTTSSPAITVGGNWVQTDGRLVVTGSSGNPVINLAGAYSQSGGTCTMSEGTGIGALNVSGDFSHSGGTLTETSSGSGAIRFARSGSQTYTSGGTVSNAINFTVNSGSQLNTGGSVLAGGGTFTLSSGGVLGIGSPAGITSSGATGNIQVTGTRTYSTGASYTYNGTDAQVTGSGLPSTVAGFTVNNPAGVTLQAGLTVSGNLLLVSGTLATGGNNISMGGDWTNNGGVLSAPSGTVTFTGTGKSIGGTASTAFPALTLASGATITLNTSASAASLAFNAAGSATSLTHAGSAVLTVAGNATLSQPTASVTTAWNINAGSASVGGTLSIGGASTTTARVAKTVLTTGSLTIAGDLVFFSAASTPQTAVVDLSTGGGTGTLNLAGALTLTYGSGTILPGSSGSVCNYNGSAAGQTVVLASAIAYHHLHLNNTSGSGALLGAAVTTSKVTGDLRIQSGLASNAAFAITGNAGRTFSVSDGATLVLAGTSSLPGGFTTRTLAPASTVRYAGPGSQTVAAENYGNLVLGGSRGADTLTLPPAGTIGVAGAFTPEAVFTTGMYRTTGSTVSFNGAGAQMIPAFRYHNLSTSGPRGSADITLASSDTIGSAGVFSPDATFAGGGYITSGSTLLSTGAGVSLPAFPYHHLVIRTSGTVSASGSWTVNGTLRTGPAAVVDAGSFLHLLRGDFRHEGTLLAGTSTFTLGGTALQTLTGSMAFHNLTLDNGAGAALSGGNASVSGLLTLTSGVLSAGADTVVVSPGASVARSSGHVAGRLRRHAPTGATTLLFPLGDAAAYTPVEVAFGNVTSAGSLTARSTPGKHPQINGAGLRTSRTVNRYYTLANAGIGFDEYDATFRFVPSDLDSAADPGNFEVRKYDAPLWSLTSTGARTSTSTQATDLTSFSDFALGEGGGPFTGTSTVSATPDSISADGASQSTVTVTLRDDEGNPLTTGGDSVHVSATLGSAGAVTDNGNGTYTALLTSSTAAGASVLRATVNGALIADSALVVCTPGPASTATSTITSDSTSIVANGSTSCRILVQLKDSFGNNLTRSGGTVALATTLGSLGAVTDSGNGRYAAVLSSGTVTGTALVTGTLVGVPIQDTAAVAFVPGTPTRLVWTHEPGDTTAGSPIPSHSSPTVEIRDQYGNLVAGATTSLTVAIGSNPGGGTLGGTTTRNASGGVAVFDNLSINKTGSGYTLVVTGGSLAPDTSAAFIITNAPPSQLAFVQQPTNAIAGNPISPPVTVRLRDAYGNDVPRTGDTTTMALGSGTGTLTGTLVQVTDSTGTAAFGDLAINLQGSKRLSASAAGLTGALSGSFSILPAPSTLVSDDFNAFNLNTGIWTYVNPRGDATLTMTGTNTPSAAVTTAIPGGIAHEPWSGTITAPRILQPANNTDFEVEVKCLSGVTLRYQLQGLVVEQDSMNYLRFDIDSDGSTTRIFMSSTVNGTPTQLVNLSIGANGVTPTWMRVKRQGDNWTQSYSLDGNVWNPTGTFARSMAVASVGVFTGNTGTTIPAHTSSFDYFFNTASPIANEDGGTAVDSIPPVISGVQVTPQDTSALIAWTTDEASTSTVAYGFTAGHEIGSVTDTALTTTHAITLNGLSPQALYHFGVSSTDVHANTGTYPDSTFATADSSTIISDDFNSFRLKSPWTFMNPLGDAVLTLVGQNSPNAWARIAVPGGAEHQPWTAGNTAPRLMQSANDRDFEVEAKFESGLTLAYQLNGIIVEQDSGNYLRFDLNSNGTNTKAYAATIVNNTPTQKVNVTVGANGAAPQWLRITRQGQTWRMDYSLNGTSWTTAGSFNHALTVARVGPFVGNSGSPAPAYTGNIDYFFKTVSPIIPEDGGIAIDDVPPVISNIQTSATGTTATITWNTDEAATSEVSFGPSAAYENGTVRDTILQTSHTLTLRGLLPASLYHFRVSSLDSSDNRTDAPDSTFTTGAASTIVSDDFNSFVLDTTVWRFINPRSDAVLTMNNTNTDSARVFIAVPGGVAHEPWTSGNTAPRILQAANNTDFELEAKFESPVAQRYQLQGLLVEESTTKYIRLDFDSDGSNTKLYAGTIVGSTPTTRFNVTVGANGVAPQYLRVRREGDLWTASYSFNGTSWTTAGSFTFSLAVDSVGAFAGNAGTTIPAHTLKLDYFFNTASPIVPEDSVGAPDPLAPVITGVQVTPYGSAALVSWTTNEVATSSVSWGPTPEYEDGTVTDTTFVTSHAVLLPGLTPASLYHFRVSSTDTAENTANYRDSTFTTGPASSIVSDDFNRFFLNTTVWRFINPLGDAWADLVYTNTDSACLRIAVPGGTAHDLWTGGRNAPRVMQAANNADFEAEIRFDSPLSQRYQIQGLVVEESPAVYLRFDLSSDGTNTRIFAASFTGGTPTVRVNAVAGVNGRAPQWMRVQRRGNQWTQSYSFDGTAFTTAGTFSFALTVDSVGIFAGNSTSGGPVPAHTARADYFFNTASPVIPEDGTLAVLDTTGPVISNRETTPGVDGFRLRWDTDEPADMLLEYGLTASYELGQMSDTSLLSTRDVTVTGLSPGLVYHYRITVRDSFLNTTVTGDFQVTTLSPPVLSLWYGESQSFGTPGNPVPAVNILGTVEDSNGVASLTYSLNGGAAVPLSVGPDSFRLEGPGDFNADIPYASLAEGLNRLILTATDSRGAAARETVTVSYAGGNTWPGSWAVDWSGAGSVQSAARILDGKWTLAGGGVRTGATGYERLLAIGDRTWRDYEVLVPVIVHALDSSRLAGPGAGVGLVLRWDGHSDSPPQVAGRQPKTGYIPLGGKGWYAWDNAGGRLEILGNDGSSIAADSTRMLSLGVSYLFRMRVKTNAGLGGLYSLKVWPESQSEPSSWDLTAQQGPGDQAAGCLLLAAHNADVTFGNLAVVPLADTLNVAVSGAGSVVRMPDMPSYNPGDTVRLAAVPDSGWSFAAWSGDIADSADTVFIVMNGNRSVTATFVPATEPAVAVRPHALLQGPYDAAGDTMKTALGNLALLPLAQPYGGAPWNYGGPEAVGSMPPGVVDWVLVELRAEPDSTVATRAALLLASGEVTDLDGSSAVRFEGLPDGPYYVVLRHRNHLAVMSSDTLRLNAAGVPCDFSTSQSQAYGINPMRQLAVGRFGLRSGDGNADGGVDALDRNLIWRAQNGTPWSYTKFGDFNLDGGIDALDLNLQWRVNNGTASQVP
ncbi:MAG: invasin domain 3-containing protein [Bacteroidota bacterium]